MVKGLKVCLYTRYKSTKNGGIYFAIFELIFAYANGKSLRGKICGIQAFKLYLFCFS